MLRAWRAASPRGARPLADGPYMMVGLTSDGQEPALRGAPHEVHSWTNVTACISAATETTGGRGAAWARLRALRLAAPAQGGGAIELMALPAVVDESYSAYFRVA